MPFAAKWTMWSTTWSTPAWPPPSCNGGASKITKAAYNGDEGQLKDAAMAKAQERVASMLDGSIKIAALKS